MKDNLSDVQAFRYAWRPDTKVFPYEDVPPPSEIDNGDNDGKYIEDIIGRTKVKTIIQACIMAWSRDGKCNVENNKPECLYDRGDCCMNSCKKNCQEIDEDGNDIRNITYNVTLTPVRPCAFSQIPKLWHGARFLSGLVCTFKMAENNQILYLAQ